jgi:RNA polymerase sigma-70 factor (ECF subfamily)
MFRHMAGYSRPVLVDGRPGVLVWPPRGLYAVMGFTFEGDRILEIDVLVDPERLRELPLPETQPRAVS